LVETQDLLASSSLISQGPTSVCPDHDTVSQQGRLPSQRWCKFIFELPFYRSLISASQRINDLACFDNAHPTTVQEIAAQLLRHAPLENAAQQIAEEVGADVYHRLTRVTPCHTVHNDFL